MAQNFIACDREQPFLLPPDVREWLPDDHLAWCVIDVVGVIDTPTQGSSTVVMTASPDFGPLGPRSSAARHEQTGAGVSEEPKVVLADSGDWHLEQSTRSRAPAFRCGSRPTPAAARTRRADRDG